LPKEKTSPPSVKKRKKKDRDPGYKKKKLWGEAGPWTSVLAFKNHRKKKRGEAGGVGSPSAGRKRTGQCAI